MNCALALKVLKVIIYLNPYLRFCKADIHCKMDRNQSLNETFYVQCVHKELNLHFSLRLLALGTCLEGVWVHDQTQHLWHLLVLGRVLVIWMP